MSSFNNIFKIEWIDFFLTNCLFLQPNKSNLVLVWMNYLWQEAVLGRTSPSAYTSEGASALLSQVQSIFHVWRDADPRSDSNSTA